MPDRETEAVVDEEVAPRSYNVTSPDGRLRRNRRNLIRLPEGQDNTETVSEDRDQITQDEAVRRSSRISRPLERFDPSWN